MNNLPRLQLTQKDNNNNNEYIIFRHQIKSKTIKNRKKKNIKKN